MPAWVTELVKLFPAFVTPVAYSALIYAFFNWLDKKASGPGKAALSAWVESAYYDRALVSNAIVEIFDKIYSKPLLGWRAILRSASLMLLLSCFLFYEFAPRDTLKDQMSNDLLGLISGALFYLLIGVVSNYISLFAVRLWLVYRAENPAVAFIGGFVIGIAIVSLCWSMVAAALGPEESALENINLFWSAIAWVGPAQPHPLILAGLAVHLWLIMILLCLGVVKLLCHTVKTISWMQWFTKHEKIHPLDAAGMVSAFIVFVTVTASVLHFIF